MNNIIKICPKCKIEKDIDNFYKRGGKRKGSASYCKACVNKTLLDRIRSYKQQCVDYKGGKCISCGYNKSIIALDFHHRDPLIKSFNISKSNRKTFDKRIKLELDKCDLLCSNCHREEHDRLLNI